MKRNNRGGAIIEITIILPLLLFLLFGGLYLLFVTLARSVAERGMNAQILLATTDFDLFQVTPAGGCGDPNNAGAPLCVAIEQQRQALATRLTNLLFKDSVNQSLFQIQVSATNPRVIVPEVYQNDLELLATTYRNTPVIFEADVSVKSIFPGLADHPFTVQTSRQFEVPLESGQVIPRDCAGNPFGSSEFGSGECNCLPNQRVSLITGQCYTCPAGTSPVQIPDPYTMDQHGCYIPFTCETSPPPVGEPVATPTSTDGGQTWSCVCPSGLNWNNGSKRCVCDVPSWYGWSRQQESGPWQWSTSEGQCTCANKVNDAQCQAMYPALAGTVRAISGGCGCECSNSCGGGYQAPTIGGNCQCTTCKPQYTGVNCSVCQIATMPTPCASPKIPDSNTCSCICPGPVPTCTGGTLTNQGCGCSCPSGTALDSSGNCTSIGGGPGHG